MVNSYSEIWKRSVSGRQVGKSDWDLEHLVLPVRRLVSEYELTWDKQTAIPTDTSVVDRLFAAGLELAEMSGVYCISTSRVIRFSQDEIVSAMVRAPRRLSMGTGEDIRWLFAREVEDSRPPIIWAGNPGAPTPEDIFLPCVKSWMQEPIVDLATCGSLTETGLGNNLSGNIWEIQAARRELSLLRRALNETGRPGMGLLAAQSAVTEIGDLAVSRPDYLRPDDAHLVAMFNELIIDQVNMARAQNSVEYGMRNASLATVMVGGLGGDAPGAAVVQIASLLLANLVCRADYHLLHPIHIRHVATSTIPVMWVQSAVTQAFARNAPCIIVADIYPKSGALTKELLYEVAANAIAAAVSGCHLEGVGSADGALPNGTGLEARWMGEVGHAVADQGLTLKEVNQLISSIYPKYAYIFELPGGNPGVRFDQAYNIETNQPVPRWLQMYEEVKKDISTLGFKVAF
jgi:methylamine--corrinoid protein Co-methyltransferase